MPVRVKICGITQADHAHVAARYGAHWLGFVFYGPSPRNLSIKAARLLSPRLPRSTERVGVFVDAPFEAIEEAVDALDLDWVQLHGSEYPADAARVRTRLGVSVIKAIGVSDAADLETAEAFSPHVDAFLFDAKPPKGPGALPGGNAVSFPWGLMRGRAFTRPWLLAGGLTSASVAAAIQASGALAVDVSSGVEDTPGIKSGEKIEAFLQAAKAVR